MSIASIMFPRHHALPKQEWTELSETMCQNKPFHLVFGMRLVQTTEGAQREGLFRWGTALSKGGRWGAGNSYTANFSPCLPFFRTRCPLPCAEREYRENTCLMCHRALTVQDQVFMAGSSIGSCLSQRACSSLKANNHRGILENYTQSKLLL